MLKLTATVDVEKDTEPDPREASEKIASPRPNQPSVIILAIILDPRARFRGATREHVRSGEEAGGARPLRRRDPRRAARRSRDRARGGGGGGARAPLTDPNPPPHFSRERLLFRARRRRRRPPQHPAQGGAVEDHGPRVRNGRARVPIRADEADVSRRGRRTCRDRTGAPRARRNSKPCRGRRRRARARRSAEAEGARRRQDSVRRRRGARARLPLSADPADPPPAAMAPQVEAQFPTPLGGFPSARRTAARRYSMRRHARGGGRRCSTSDQTASPRTAAILGPELAGPRHAASERRRAGGGRRRRTAAIAAAQAEMRPRGAPRPD